MSTASYDRLGDSDEQWTCPTFHCNKFLQNSTPSYQTQETLRTISQKTFPFNKIISSIPSDISFPGLSSTTDTEQHSSMSVNSSGRPLDSEISMTSSPKAQTTPTYSKIILKKLKKRQAGEPAHTEHQLPECRPRGPD